MTRRAEHFSNSILHFVLKLAWWIEGVIQIPSFSSNGRIYIAKNLKSRGAFTRLYIRFTKNSLPFLIMS